MSADASASYGKRSPALKNMGAFHELMRRNGFAMPDLSSKFINQNTLFGMYSGQIYSLKQIDVVYREVAKPPTKLMMVQKFEDYLSRVNVKSGIDMAKKNFPDKTWLILAVATLSRGQDEIFDPEYVPSKKLDK